MSSILTPSRNPDGSALTTDAESLRAEREKLRKARAVAMAHTSVEGGQFMFTPWSPQELTAHREVLQRFTGQGQGFSYLNNAKAKMRTENNGATPVINYKHQQTDKTTGAKTTVGRKFYNRAADQVVNRKWWAYMADIMETNEDNSPVCHDLTEVFHLD